MDASAVRAHLAKILSSGGFSQSERLGRFLRFTVESVLEGRASALKEYVIGVEVYGRGDSYDPKTDAIVRVEAVRLRSKLKRYYESDGRRDTILIEFQKGSYAPTIRVRDAATREAAGNAVADQPFSSIAVLPFANRSSDPESESFSDGLTEELISSLTQFSTLRVVARTSVFQFKGKALDVRDIARRLNADTVLEGSVRKAENRLRIAVQLIDAASGFHLWSETYEREWKDIFAIQDEIGRSVAAALRVKFTAQPDSHTSMDAEAYAYYLKGRHLFNKWTFEDVQKSFTWYERALERDPGFAKAWAASGDSHNILAYWGHSPEVNIPLARKALTRALELDNTLADAHSMLAALHAVHEWKWSDAERRFRHALELAPGSSTTHFMYAIACLIPFRRLKEAAREVTRALELDPLSLGTQLQTGRILYFEQRYEEAIRHFSSILELDSGFREAHWQMGLVYEEQEKYPEAIASFGRALALSSESVSHAGTLGHCYAKWGKRSEAQKILSRLNEDPDSPAILFSKALIHLGLGQGEAALVYLEHLLPARSPLLVRINLDPRFDPVRNEPKFTALLRSIGFID